MLLKKIVAIKAEQGNKRRKKNKEAANIFLHFLRKGQPAAAERKLAEQKIMSEIIKFSTGTQHDSRKVKKTNRENSRFLSRGIGENSVIERKQIGW